MAVALLDLMSFPVTVMSPVTVTSPPEVQDGPPVVSMAGATTPLAMVVLVPPADLVTFPVNAEV
jgi:hypothetical protein